MTFRTTAFVLLLAIGLLPAPAQAQPTGQPPGDKPADKPSYDEEVWYKVVQGDGPIGYQHFYVDKVETPGSPATWQVVEESEVTPVKGLPSWYSGRSTVLLTDKWALVGADWGGYWSTEGKAGPELRFKAQFDGKSGTLTVDGPKEEDTAEFPKFVIADCGIESMIGKFLLSKGLQEDKKYPFKLLTGLPLDPPYAEITIQVLKRATLDCELGKFSGFNCTLTIPPSGETQKEAIVWNLFIEEQKGWVLRKEYAAGKLVIEAATEAVGISQQAPFAARGRRDPFRNPMVTKPVAAPTPGGRAGGTPGVPTLATLAPEDRKQMQQRARDLLAKMKSDHDDASLPADKKTEFLRANYDQVSKLVFDAEQKEKKELRWVEEMRKIRGSAQELYTGIERLAADMDRLHGEALACFESANYKLLKEKLSEAENIAKGLANVDDDRPEKKKILKNLVSIRDLDQRSKKREAFAAKKLQIIGIIYYLVPEPVSLLFGAEILGQRIEVENTAEVSRSRSTAILKLGNDPSIRVEGEELDRDIRIQKIERQAVVFSFQGELIRVDLGRE